MGEVIFFLQFQEFQFGGGVSGKVSRSRFIGDSAVLMEFSIFLYLRGFWEEVEVVGQFRLDFRGQRVGYDSFGRIFLNYLLFFFGFFYVRVVFDVLGILWRQKNYSNGNYKVYCMIFFSIFIFYFYDVFLGQVVQFFILQMRR